jgi:regulatory protein
MARYSASKDDKQDTAKAERDEDPQGSRISSVEKRASGTAKIVVGGSSFFVDEAYFPPLGLDPADLVVGRDLDEATFSGLALAAAATEAGRQAASLLARAEQSRYLLSAKLGKKGAAQAAIRLALDRLEGLGLLSDRRYAEAWLRSQVGKSGQSPARLGLALRSRGIDEEVAKAALAEVFGPEEREAALGRAVKKEEKRQESKGLSPRQARSELQARLRAQGFKAAELRAWFEKRDGEE